MSPPESSSVKEAPLSLEAKQKFYNRLLEEVGRQLAQYEPFYLSPNEAQQNIGSPPTQKRFRSFWSWIKVMSERKRFLNTNMSHTKLEEDVTEMRQIYEVLLALARGEAIGGEMWEKYGKEPLLEGEYRVYVDYATFPTMQELSKEGIVADADAFNGFTWRKHSVSASKVEDIPGEKIFCLLPCIQSITPEEFVAQLEMIGYRPATHLEAFAFREIFMTLPKNRLKVAAPGSYAWNMKARFMILMKENEQLRFTYGLYNDTFNPMFDAEGPDIYFLAIRE